MKFSALLMLSLVSFNSLAVEVDDVLTVRVLRGEVDYRQLSAEQQKSVQAAQAWLSNDHCQGCNDLCMQVSASLGKESQAMDSLIKQIPKTCVDEELIDAYQTCQDTARHSTDQDALLCLQGLREYPHAPHLKSEACLMRARGLPFQRETLISALKQVIDRCQ